MYFFSIALRKEVFKSRMLSLSVPLTLQRDFKRKSMGQTKDRPKFVFVFGAETGIFR